jgi:rod shape-determining protein MreC
LSERWNQVLLVLLLGLHSFLLSKQPATAGNRLERATMRVLGPLSQLVAGGTASVGRGVDSWRLLSSLRRENAELRAELDANRQLVVRLRAAEEELHGRRRARWQSPAFGEGFPVDVVFIDPSSWLRVMFVHSPTQQPRTNRPVVTADGLVGRIVSPADQYAKVLMITDRSAAVSAMIERTRRQGLIEGDGASRLWLRHIPAQYDVRVGDRVITAGVDGIFPRGLPIGTVRLVEPDQGIFHRIVVEPAVDFGRLEKVFVLERMALPEEIVRQVGAEPAPPGAAPASPPAPQGDR